MTNYKRILIKSIVSEFPMTKLIDIHIDTWNHSSVLDCLELIGIMNKHNASNPEHLNSLMYWNEYQYLLCIIPSNAKPIAEIPKEL